MKPCRKCRFEPTAARVRECAAGVWRERCPHAGLFEPPAQLPLFWKPTAGRPAIGAVRVRVTHPEPVVGLNVPWANLNVERLNGDGGWEPVELHSEWGENPRRVAERAETLAARYPGAKVVLSARTRRPR